MNTYSQIDIFVERLCREGADINRLDFIPWIDEMERKLKLQFPPSFRSFVGRYTFPLLDIGDVELFANKGDNSDYDLKVALFRDPYMSPWLIERKLIHIGHPFIGNYDPVCFDLSNHNLIESPIVQLKHEDIILGRETVNYKTIAENFFALLERAQIA